MKGGWSVLFLQNTSVAFTNKEKPAFYNSLPDKEGTCYQII